MKTTFRYLSLNAQAAWHRQVAESESDSPAKPSRRTDGPEALPGAGVPERFRRLKWNEVVCQGDFVADERLGLERWEGPGGFRADTFVKPVYRRNKSRLTTTKKLK